jgi:hypothetical protein
MEIYIKIRIIMRAKVFIVGLMCCAFITVTKAQITFELTLRNTRNYAIPVSFSKGQFFEVQVENVQNIVLFDDTVIILQPYETKTIQLEGFCADEHRDGPPEGASVIPTAVEFIPRREVGERVFRSQREIWDELRRR